MTALLTAYISVEINVPVQIGNKNSELASLPALPMSWETAPKCPRFRFIPNPKFQTTVRVDVPVKVRRPTSKDDVDTSDMVSTFVPLTLDKPHFDRIVRACAVRPRNPIQRSANEGKTRIRLAFIPPHISALASSSLEDGVIVGSPPCRRRGLMEHARKYDPWR